MSKGKLREQLNLVDVVIEVRDARIPLSSAYPNIQSLINNTPRIIVLNKADLVEQQGLLLWKKLISEKEKITVIPAMPADSSINNQIINLVLKLAKPKGNVLIASELVTIKGHIKLFQVVINVKIASVTTAGIANGKAIL